MQRTSQIYKWLQNMPTISRGLLICVLCMLLGVLIFTRFVNLGWGLPYPMHPDERNMADSIVRLQCVDVSELWQAVQNIVTGLTPRQAKVECLNPHFFAYGQATLYMGAIISYLLRIVFPQEQNQFVLAVYALRMIAASASVATFFVMLRLTVRIVGRALYAYETILVSVIYIFVPTFIQFAHFGTTESILMLLFTLIVYQSMRAYDFAYIRWQDIATTSILCGIALGIKISALPYLMVPMLVYCVRWLSLFWRYCACDKRAYVMVLIGDTAAYIRYVFFATVVIGLFFVATSPHNILNMADFISSIRYESDVGLGRYIAFYTRQFLYEIPVVFQVRYVFPYALGIPLSIMAICGFVFLPWRNRYVNTVRMAVVTFLLPNLFVYAKWTRFTSPVFPLLVVLAGACVIVYFKRYTLLGIVCIVATTLYGVAFLYIFTTPDVRYIASAWVFQNIPSGSKILSETANVIDIPIAEQTRMAIVPPQGFSIDYISFNHYDVDDNPLLAQELEHHIATADYIFIPSRRVFYNHTCLHPDTHIPTHHVVKCRELRRKYPVLHSYYARLFSGKLGFEEVARFSSFPRIVLFGKTIFSVPDESAEETATVFEHPVIRIYKRIKPIAPTRKTVPTSSFPAPIGFLD